MKPREGLRLLLIVAAALVAAFTFRIAAQPEEIHDPGFARRYHAASAQLPILEAVRVRSETPDAAQRLRNASHGTLGRILDPSRSTGIFRYGRLLYSSPEEVQKVLEDLRQGVPPKELPGPPDLAAFYRDRRGAFACDVNLRERDSLDLIRSVLPDAALSGDPVTREAEERQAEDLPRALILGIAVGWGCLIFRRKGVDAERRLLAAFLPLAVICGLDWGVDTWTVLAAALVMTVSDGPGLLCAAPCIFFPALALKRIGIVFLLGGLARWRRPATRSGARRRSALVTLALLLGTGGLLLWTYEPQVRLPEGLQLEPAATFVAGQKAAQKAAELRAAGLKTVVGEKNPIPPDPDLRTRRLLSKIYRQASFLERTAPEAQRPRFHDVAQAAALDSLYLPASLRARLRTKDGRWVLWVQEEGAIDHDELESAELYRSRGERGLRRNARWAAWIALLIAGLAFARRRGSVHQLVLRFAVAASCALLLHLAARAGFDVAPETTFPLLVVASMLPAWPAILAVIAAGLGMHSVLGFPAGAIALCGLISLLVSRPLR
jgi:hypothetical protein